MILWKMKDYFNNYNINKKEVLLMVNHFIKKELGFLFESEESLDDFVVLYWSGLNENVKSSDIDTFGWASVADDIYMVLGQTPLEVGDFVAVEIGSYYSCSGNPELIHVGELVDIPVENQDGDFVGSYKFV